MKLFEEYMTTNEENKLHIFSELFISFFNELKEEFSKEYEGSHPTSIEYESINEIFVSKLNDYVNNTLAPKLKLDNIVWMAVIEKNQKAMSYLSNKNGQIIKINLFNLCNRPDDKIYHWIIKKKLFIVSIFHEWTHYLQDIRMSKKSGKKLTAKTIGSKYRSNYFSIPHEQMALAAGELAYIKTILKKTTPEEILDWLKKSGITHSEKLRQLKQTDRRSYNKILKYIVLFLLKNKFIHH